MKHQNLLVISGILLLVVLTLVTHLPSFFSLPLHDQKVSTKSLGGQYMRFRDFYQTGDFAAYFVSAGSFDSVDKSNNYLKVVKSSGGTLSIGVITRDFANISTNNELHNYNLLVRYRAYIQMSGNGWRQIALCFFYTDGSYDVVLNYETSNYAAVDSGQYWVNATFDNGKTLDYIQGWIATYVAQCELWVYREIYDGYCPTIENWTVVDNYIRVNTPTTFSALGSNNSGLQVNFGFESGGATVMQCFTDWTVLHGWYNVTSFTREGLYDYSYTVYNEWGISVTTPTYYFTVATLVFPMPSYLSLYNALSGFPLASKDFKIYLGDPDTRELINFRTFTGSWAVLNYNNLVNASLMVNGTFEDQALVDNYIAIQAAGNGLKSPFENGMTYNTTLWTMLQFQVKVFQPTWIVIIYNPVVWEKDFYLYIGAQYVGYWLDVSIPFFNFTSYVDVTHQTCYELGFWISNATILLANIRVASWYTWNGTAYEANPYRLCSLANRQNPNELVFDSPVETICIQDFYNNTLYYADVAYTPFLDIALPICDATFYNYENTTILVQIYRGLNTYLEIVIPPHSSVTVPVYCTNYRVHILVLQQLSITYFSPNQTRNTIITIGTEQNITFPNFWEQLLQFLFQTPLGITLIVLFCIYMTYSVYRTIRPPRVVFKIPKVEEKTKEKKVDKELQDQLTKAQKEKAIWVGH